MKSIRRSWLLGLVVIGISCAETQELRPAPEAQVEPADPRRATQSINGVRVTVSPGQWRGFPLDLDEHVVPLLVETANDTQLPLRIRYSEMRLIDDKGREYSAMPPLRIEGTALVRAPVHNVEFGHRGYFLAPYYYDYYPGLPLWADPFGYDPFYYDRLYAEWRVDLPTDDMLARALPEGVLRNGTASGFVYFQKLEDDARRVSFQLDVINADTGRPLGRVEIPFIVEG